MGQFALLVRALACVRGRKTANQDDYHTALKVAFQSSDQSPLATATVYA